MNTRLLPSGANSLTLDPQRIVLTVERLHDRISERFPDSGLAALAAQLVGVARLSVDRLRWVAQPHLPLRIAIGFMLGFIVALVGTAVGLFSRDMPSGLDTVASLLQALDSIVSELFYLGAVLLFLVTMEGRIKRRRALRFLRELRALAHIIDMHQLTKDPDRLSVQGEDTASSPERALTRFELGRYLDYCSEMLSLISKLAALYIQNVDDPVVLAAVDEVETLTTGLSGKIWQKIMILERSN